MMGTKEQNQSRSPVQDRKFNRQAGETLREELDDLLAESMYLAGAGILVTTLATVSFIFIHIGYPVVPLLVGQAIVGFGSIGLGIHRVVGKGRRLKRGLDAERAVGQELQGLEKIGFHVIHDIPSLGRRGANIDHVLIGSSGVYAIETKWKTKHGDHRLDYDGRTISTGGHPLRDDPIPQAKAAARDLESIIEENSGLAVKAIPVVLYPGWYVNGGTLRQTNGYVSVLSDKHFVKLVKDINVKALQPADAANIRAGILRHAEGSRKHGLHR